VGTAGTGDFVFANVRSDSWNRPWTAPNSSAFGSAKIRSAWRDCKAMRTSSALRRSAGSNKYWEQGSFDCSETQAALTAQTHAE